MRTHHGDGSRDVVEHAVLAGLLHCKSKEYYGTCGHDGADGPVKVGATNSDGDISGLAVDSVCYMGFSSDSLKGQDIHTVHVQGIVASPFKHGCVIVMYWR